MNQEKELETLGRRLIDLADKCDRQGIYTYSDFLGLAEQDVFHRVKTEIGRCPFTLFGGLEHSERVMVRFGSEEMLGYEEPFPIVCLRIAPAAPKFAEELGHRDYLGALMNLGFERSLLGDIRIQGKEAFLFCHENMRDVICEGLTAVRHTNVRVFEVEADKLTELHLSESRSVSVNLSSLRIDAIIAKLYNISRGRSQELVSGGRVFINGRECTQGSAVPRENDIVSVRGVGRFVVRSQVGETRKGKLVLEVGVF